VNDIQSAILLCDRISSARCSDAHNTKQDETSIDLVLSRIWEERVLWLKRPRVGIAQSPETEARALEYIRLKSKLGLGFEMFSNLYTY
jgi:hypothetical protein